MSLRDLKPTSELCLDEICWRLMEAKGKGLLDDRETRFAPQFYGACKRNRETQKQIDWARKIVHSCRKGRGFEPVIDWLD